MVVLPNSKLFLLKKLNSYKYFKIKYLPSNTLQLLHKCDVTFYLNIKKTLEIVLIETVR